MNTGERIKSLRIAKGLSQEQLGAMIGVQKAAINKYENGTVINLKRSTIAKLAEALDVSPLYILGLEDKSPRASIGVIPLHKKLDYLCKRNGTTIDALWKAQGYPLALLSQMRSGDIRDLPEEVKESIASHFDISPDFFIPGVFEETLPATADAQLLDDLFARFELKKANTPTSFSKDGCNLVLIAGRDGSYVEKRLTDEQLAALTALIDQLPEAEDI